MFPKRPRRWPGVVFAVVVVIFVVKNPAAAAHLINHAGGLLSQGANAPSRFASALHLD